MSSLRTEISLAQVDTKPMTSYPTQRLCPSPRPRRIRRNRPPLSQFAKRSAAAWDFRPSAECIYDNLDAYFPDHDLDNPITDISLSTSRNGHIGPPFQNDSVESGNLFNEQKSIRTVAAEHCTRVSRKGHTSLCGSRDNEMTSAPNLVLPFIGSDSPVFAPISKQIEGENVGKDFLGLVCLTLNGTTVTVKQIPQADFKADRSAIFDGLVPQRLGGPYSSEFCPVPWFRATVRFLQHFLRTRPWRSCLRMCTES